MMFISIATHYLDVTDRAQTGVVHERSYERMHHINACGLYGMLHVIPQNLMNSMLNNIGTEFLHILLYLMIQMLLNYELSLLSKVIT